MEFILLLLVGAYIWRKVCEIRYWNQWTVGSKKYRYSGGSEQVMDFYEDSGGE